MGSFTTRNTAKQVYEPPATDVIAAERAKVGRQYRQTVGTLRDLRHRYGQAWAERVRLADELRRLAGVGAMEKGRAA